METKLLSFWDSLLGSAAIVATIVLGLCVMVGAVKPRDAPRHLVAIAGVIILLTMLPAIIFGLWNTMTFEQHLCIIVLVLMIAFLLGVSPKEKRRRSRETRR